VNEALLPPSGWTLDSLLHSHLLWYLNRGTGVVLVAVLTLSTALGLLSVSGRGSQRWPRFARQSLHRNVSVIACGLLVAHALTPVLDTYVNHYAPIGWLDTLVPFASAYKPLAMGLGTLALDLVVVVVLSSVARHRFGHRAWFSLHLLSYAAWGLGLVHGFLIGSDSRTVWGLGVTAAAVLVVLVALVARVARPASGASAAAARPAPAGPPEPAPTRGRRRASRREREQAADAAYGPTYGQGYGQGYSGAYGQGRDQGATYGQAYADPGYDTRYADPGYDTRYADTRYADPGYDARYEAQGSDPYGRPDDADDLRYDPLAEPAQPPETRSGRRATGRRAKV
jgi:sulfoxide reductase heme-binding subunit YedZ